MWALGKSATDYYAKSVIETANWKFCNGDKESFKPGAAHGRGLPLLNAKNLRACVERNQPFAHIKPEHLKHGQPDFADPEVFFQAVFDAGWTVVVALQRENSFARQLSGINWRLGHVRDPKLREHQFIRHFCHMGDVITGQYEPERKIMTAGIRAALKAGLKVLYLSYADVTIDPCGSVRDTLKLYDPNRNWTECVLDVNNTHSKTHVSLPLSEHLGAEALVCAQATFDRHPGWSWMLEDGGHRSSPPDTWPQIDHNISHPMFFHRPHSNSTRSASPVPPVTNASIV